MKDSTMTLRDEAGAFLRSRRRRLDPDALDLPGPPKNRRRPGLRRDEVARLASISTQYYTRIEQGHLAGVSDSILLAVAKALQLDDAERWHLFGLSRGQESASFRPWAPSEAVRPELQLVLDAITVPAMVFRLGADIVASNLPARAVFSPLFGSPFQPPNNVRFMFLDPMARRFYVDWAAAADNATAVLHAGTAHFPKDERLAAIIAELRAKSREFAAPDQS